ncbi:MAG: hypothetical protein M3247_02145 [Thermoproteota archaeon]|nr:hypothetical protein [Thermoproteota archaeon]
MTVIDDRQNDQVSQKDSSGGRSGEDSGSGEAAERIASNDEAHPLL